MILKRPLVGFIVFGLFLTVLIVALLFATLRRQSGQTRIDATQLPYETP